LFASTLRIASADAEDVVPSSLVGTWSDDDGERTLAQLIVQADGTGVVLLGFTPIKVQWRFDPATKLLTGTPAKNNPNKRSFEFTFDPAKESLKSSNVPSLKAPFVQIEKTPKPPR
jgi:hypothetical protein